MLSLEKLVATGSSTLRATIVASNAQGTQEGAHVIMPIMGVDDQPSRQAHLIRRFTENGLSVCVLDLPGQTRTSTNPGEYNPEAYVEIVACATEQLHKDFDNVDGWAHSYGGLVAAKAVDEYGGMDTLTLVNTPVKWNDIHQRQVVALQAGFALPGLFKLVNNMVMKWHTDDPAGLIHHYQNLGSIPATLQDSKIPVLMVLGQEDALGRQPSQEMPLQARRLLRALCMRDALTAYLPMDNTNHYANERNSGTEGFVNQLIVESRTFLPYIDRMAEWVQEPVSGIISVQP